TQLKLFDTIVNAQSAILYVQEKFEGRSVKIESGRNTSCFNLDYDEGLSLNFNSAIDSIKLSPGTCLQLYETPFCSGEFKVLSDWDNTNCQERLERCNLKATLSSISFCSTFLIPNKSNINRITSHKPCSGECSHPETALHLDHKLLATIYSEKSFEGYSTTIIGRANETKCFNLEYDFERQINFYQAVMSVSIENAACLNLYDGMGCTGNTLKLMLQSETKLCLRDLQTCSWNTRVQSLSFCGSNFPGQYNHSQGFRKGYCYENNCNTRRGSYFWCVLESKDSWDFCSHRPNLNYMGENWGHESYHSDDSVMHLILYTQRHFEGNQPVMKTFERTRCVNTMTWDDNLNLTDRKLIGSIDIKWHCLVLHDQIVCTGDSLEIFPDDTENCHQDLESCGWSNRISSISLCDAHFPPKFVQSNGSHGDECKSTCEPRGELYFWCQVGSLPHEVDFCLPRPHQDYYGNHCEENCSATDPWTLIHLNPSSSGSDLKNSLSLTITVLLQTLRFICLNAGDT
ncbi:unnamed protein product, partial [Allacma fusca]